MILNFSANIAFFPQLSKSKNFNPESIPKINQQKKHPLVVGMLFCMILDWLLEGLEGVGYVVLDAVGEVVAGLLVEF